MLRFVLCLLCFCRFHFLYIYQELCWMRGLCISFPCFLFPVGGGVKGLRTRGLKNFRTGRVTDLRGGGGGGFFAEGGGRVGTPLDAMVFLKSYSMVMKFFKLF